MTDPALITAIATPAAAAVGGFFAWIGRRQSAKQRQRQEAAKQEAARLAQEAARLAQAATENQRLLDNERIFSERARVEAERLQRRVDELEQETDAQHVTIRTLTADRDVFRLRVETARHEADQLRAELAYAHRRIHELGGP